MYKILLCYSSRLNEAKYLNWSFQILTDFDIQVVNIFSQKNYFFKCTMYKNNVLEKNFYIVYFENYKHLGLRFKKKIYYLYSLYYSFNLNFYQVEAQYFI